jgi:hypothetical protein
MLGATMLLAWSIWFSWRRLEPYVDVGWLWLQRSVGYVDGQWTWRLRTPWERIGPSPNPRQEITRPVSFYQAHVDQTGAAHEVLARYLFALDELISKPVSSSGEVNNQSRAFESLRAEIIAFVRQAVSHSEAYHLAHPGLSIITRDPDAFDDAHNALRHRMYAFCESLRHAHRRELPPLDKAQRISTLAVQPIPTESAARYYSQAERDRILEAMDRISRLINEKAMPARDAAELLMRQWNLILVNEGEPAFRAKLKQVRRLVEELASDVTKIDQDYDTLRAHVGSVLESAAFAGRYFDASDAFRDSAQKLPSQIDARVLDLLIPARDRLQVAVNGLQQWMNDTYQRKEAKLEEVRRWKYPA